MSNPRMITLTVTGVLLEFHSHTEWVNKATRWYRNCGVHSARTIAVDSVGRVCATGREFMRARDEGTFPVKVYEI